MSVAGCFLLLCLCTAGFADKESLPGGDGNWAAWRGPLATGVAPDGNPPSRWAEGSNLLWKIAVPGLGHSSPIVWKDRILITTAVETDKETDPAKVKEIEAGIPEWSRNEARLPKKVVQFTVMALKRSDGSVLWKKVVHEEAPHEGTHSDGSWASGSPLTDGERVYAYFGSYGLYCLSMDGEKVWDKQLGHFKMKMNFGEGASPALSGDLLILNQDQEGPGFVAAFDKKTGEQKWKMDRDEMTSWSTPLVLERDGKRQVIVSATKRIRSYDVSSGTLLWECGGMTTNVIPCVVADSSMAYCMSGFRGNSIVAIKLAGASGDITGKKDVIAWASDKDAPYTPSPALCDGMLYYLKGNEGLLTCAEAATGKILYGTQKLDGIKQIFASPVMAGGRLYVVGKNGVTVVIKAGPTFEVLATNTLDDQFTASPAVFGKELYLRGHKNLYCIK